jgi:hypothetical protein
MRWALRRAWADDPAIRDFIGLSENAWDFTAAGGVPGFGPLSVEDAARLLARTAGPVAVAEDASRPEAAAAPPDAAAPATAATTGPSSEEPAAGDLLDRPDEILADAITQPRLDEARSGQPQPPRRHGGALPT